MFVETRPWIDKEESLYFALFHMSGLWAGKGIKLIISANHIHA